MLDRLLCGGEAQANRLEAERLDSCCREQREPVGTRLGGGRALEQPMDEDDIGSGQLIPTGDPTPDVRAVMDEQLQVKLRRQLA